jgi:hypothetical protein
MPNTNLSYSQLKNIIINGTLSDQTFINGQGNIELKEIEFLENIAINQDRVNAPKEILFRNCKFEKVLSLIDFSVGSKIIFDNCIFNGDVGVTLNRTPIEFHNDCHFKGDLNINSQNSSNNVVFSGFKIDKTLSLEGVFAQLLELSNVNLSNPEAKSDSKLIFRNVTIDKLVLYKVSFSRIEFILNSNFRSEAKIEQSRFGDLICNNITIGRWFDVNSCQFDSVSVDNLRGNRKFRVLETEIISNFSVVLSQLSETQITKCKIAKLNLHGTNQSDSKFLLDSSEINQLLFDSVINQGSLTIRSLNQKQDSNTILSIMSSDLKNSSFIQCNLSRGILQFENSKISDVFFSESDFPKRVQLHGKKDNYQAQLAFGQLVTCFEKQGDSVRAIEYHARAIKAHYRHIHLFSKDWLKKINLFFYRISNDFGMNWLLGIGFSFAIGIIFFYFLVLSSKEFHFELPISFDHRFVVSFLKFMNPLRFLETESLFRINGMQEYLNLNVCSYAFDFFGRIFVAFGYYQTIQAFRRFGRTG